MTCPDFPLNPINTIILAPFLLLTSRLAPPLQVPPHLRFGDQGLGKQRQRHVRGLWGEKKHNVKPRFSGIFVGFFD